MDSKRLALGAAFVAAALAFTAYDARAQAACTTLAGGLLNPMGLVQSNQGSFVVAEAGTPTPNSGRISLVSADGARRTLVDGLPSGLSDVGDPNGPGGLAMRGRTLYVAIGVGDVGVLGRDANGNVVRGSDLPNPNGPSSPLFSSVLALHFSADVEKTSGGFTLTMAQQQALAGGEQVVLGKGGDRLTIERVVDFPNYVPFPHPLVAGNVQLSNPFGIVAVGDQLYVTDGGRNRLWQVDVPSGGFATLATFPNTPNPFFPNLGPPTSDAVPTGIVYDTEDEALYVTLFRGNPFAPGRSSVERIDPLTGAHGTFIGGLKTAIGVLPAKSRGDTDYLVLQFSSGAGPFFPGPGVVLRFDTPASAPEQVANCLVTPTAMLRDAKTGTLHAIEFGTGRLVSVPLAQ